MDKHQRMYISRWEQKKAKDQRKFEEELKRQSYKNALKDIERTVLEYLPPPEEVFARARKALSDPFNGSLGRGWRYDFIMDMFHDDEDPFLYPLIYARDWRLSITKEEREIEIERGKRLKQNQEVRDVTRTLRRHQTRVNAIRDELTKKTNRLRAIQNCALVKEELMMNVWHPRRVEKFLDAYGWEAYDNLLGVE